VILGYSRAGRPIACASPPYAASARYTGPGPHLRLPGGVADLPSCRDEPEQLAPLEADSTGRGQLRQVGVVDSGPGAAAPGRRRGGPPEAPQAPQRGVGPGVPGRGRIDDVDLAVDDGDPPERGQLHQSRAHQAHGRDLRGDMARVDRQESEIGAQRAHPGIGGVSHADTLTTGREGNQRPEARSWSWDNWNSHLQRRAEAALAEAGTG
jgi:hypothetical protein